MIRRPPHSAGNAREPPSLVGDWPVQRTTESQQEPRRHAQTTPCAARARGQARKAPRQKKRHAEVARAACIGAPRNSGISSHELGKELKLFFFDNPRVRVNLSPSSLSCVPGFETWELGGTECQPATKKVAIPRVGGKRTRGMSQGNFGTRGMCTNSGNARVEVGERAGGLWNSGISIRLVN